MALSGTITGTTSNSGIESKIIWSATQSIDGNYSTITARGILNWKSNLKTWGTGTYYMSIDGEQKSNTVYAEIGYGTNTQVISFTKTVNHATNGTKSLILKFSGGISGTTLTSISCQATITLDTIPRASSFTLPDSANAGSNFTVTITRASTSFTHDVKITFGSKTKTYSNVATSATCQVPLDWLSEIPDATSGVCTVEVTTKNGSTVIGKKTDSLTINVPSSVVPTVSVKALTAVSQKWSKYIQGKSKVKIELTAAGKYGSKITNYSIVGGGYNGTTNPYTTGVLLQSGTYNFVCKVTDSRGRTATVNTANITVQAYEEPKLTAITVVRSNSGGTASSNGTYIAITATASYSSVGGSNTLAIKAYYREKGASSWGSATTLTSGSKKVIGGGAVATNKYYEVMIRLTDGYGNYDFTTAIGTASFINVWGADRAGILMYPEGAGIYLGGNTTVKGTLKVTGTVTAPTFSGKLSGNASTATKATNADNATKATTATNATNATNASNAEKVKRLNQLLEDSTGSNLTALMRRKVDLIRQIASGQDGVYCVHAGWSGMGWGFTIGAHYAGANVTDAVFFQGEEIDTIRKNGNTYGAVKQYKPG